MSAHESGSRSGGERGRGSRRRGERNQVPTGPGWEELFTPPELIVIAKRDVGLRAHPDGVASASGADVGMLSTMLGEEGGSSRSWCE